MLRIPIENYSDKELVEAIRAGICNDNWGNACNNAYDALAELEKRLNKC